MNGAGDRPQWSLFPPRAQSGYETKRIEERRHGGGELFGTRDQREDRVLRPRSERQDDEPREDLRQRPRDESRPHGLDEDADRPYALLRSASARPGRPPGNEDPASPLHRAGTGLLQRNPEARAEGRRRCRLRRGFRGGQDGGEPRELRQPRNEPQGVRDRHPDDPARSPVQQAGPSERGPGLRSEQGAEPAPRAVLRGAAGERYRNFGSSPRGSEAPVRED